MKKIFNFFFKKKISKQKLNLDSQKKTISWIFSCNRIDQIDNLLTWLNSYEYVKSLYLLCSLKKKELMFSNNTNLETWDEFNF